MLTIRRSVDSQRARGFGNGFQVNPSSSNMTSVCSSYREYLDTEREEQKMGEASSPKDRFLNAAADHGKYTLSGDSTACNEAYDRVIAAIKDLRKLPDQGEGALMELATHPNDSVKVWASSYLLPLQQEHAINILEKVASSS